METSLHRQLKEQYGPAAGGRLEVVLEGFRIDAVAADGDLVEVQSGPLGPLRAKLGRLLPDAGKRQPGAGKQRHANGEKSNRMKSDHWSNPWKNGRTMAAATKLRFGPKSRSSFGYDYSSI